jgi:hypothetical protein
MNFSGKAVKFQSGYCNIHSSPGISARIRSLWEELSVNEKLLPIGIKTAALI